MTLVSDLREPVRAILGDHDEAFPAYADDAIDRVVRTLIRLGRLPGYALDSLRTSITPEVASGDDLALLTYETCLTFLAPDTADYRFDLRALKHRLGEQKLFFFRLLDLVEETQASRGPLLRTSLDFQSWITSVTGSNIWTSLTDMEVTAPVDSVSIGPGGLETSATSSSTLTLLRQEYTLAAGQTTVALPEPCVVTSVVFNNVALLSAGWTQTSDTLTLVSAPSAPASLVVLYQAVGGVVRRQEFSLSAGQTRVTLDRVPTQVISVAYNGGVLLAETYVRTGPVLDFTFSAAAESNLIVLYV